MKCYLWPIIYISCHRSETYSFVRGIGNTDLMRLTEVNHEYDSRCKEEQDTGVIKKKKEQCKAFRQTVYICKRNQICEEGLPNKG